MSWDTGLHGQALNVAKIDQRRLRVVAGPGTGKSFALMRRVARLLEEGQDPMRIMAVTFTRNAADSLVTDLKKLNVTGCEKVHVGTLHSYCFSLLNREEVFQYLDRTPRPIITFPKSGSLQFEGRVMLDDLGSQQFGKKRDCTKRIRAFEAAWARMQSDPPGWAQDEIDNKFQIELINWLKFHKAMLIGELVPEALRFLRNNPMSNALTKFDHVIVDEYQDLNRAEQEIIDMLSQNGAAAIVGDADQSIYSFRHAHPEGIEEYGSRHPATYNESLRECRRCPKGVVLIADQLIRKNHPDSYIPRLQAKSDNCEGEIRIVQWNEPNDEAEGVAGFISHIINNRGYRPGEILVITPRRRLAYPIRDIIREKGIPVYSFYQEEALEEEDAQRTFALLTLLNNKEDRVALRWWLGHKSSSGLKVSYKKLRQYCEESGDSPRSVLEAIDQGNLSLSGTSHLLRPFRELKEIIERLSKLSLPDLVDSLLPEDDNACAALRELAVRSLEKSKDIGELFDHIRTYITQPEVPEGDFIKIMSPQKAKGLTSKVVIVTSCIEGLLPFTDNELTLPKQEEAIREQRRLFYVAITRCTEILVLSSFTQIERSLAMNIGTQIQRYSGGIGRTVTSRFIDELGPMAPRRLSGIEWRISGYSDVI